MFQNKRIIAIIPARAGSKGVPGKNHCKIAGRPLVEWTFSAVKECTFFDEIICSTDDSLVKECARLTNIRVLHRPINLSKDTTPMLDVLLHVLQRVENPHQPFDYIVLLQPTSPLRTSTDITKAVNLAIKNKAKSVASVSPVDLRPGLLLIGSKPEEVLKTTPLAPNYAELRRQDAPKLYRVNGTVYVFKRSFLKPNAKLNTPSLGIVLPKSHTLDIDTFQDFERCERALLRRLHKEL